MTLLPLNKTVNTCLLLVNIGSPKSPEQKDVRNFLTRLLNDKNVISLPDTLRKLLVNNFIIPFHISKSTMLYQKLYEKEKDSPLLYHTKSLIHKLSQLLPENVHVEMAMLFSPPYLHDVMNDLKIKNFDWFILFPMYPQYAKSTGGATIKHFENLVNTWDVKPKTHIIPPFFDQNGWINALSEAANNFDVHTYDHILFSYHSLPLKHINNVHPERSCLSCYCETYFKEDDRMCYKAACYRTSRILAQRLNVAKKNFTTCFQSRFGRKWLPPFADKMIKQLAMIGYKKVLVFTPSFTTDCLETLVEINIDYKQLFLKYGGKALDLVPCPNDSDIWVEGVADIVFGKDFRLQIP